MTSIYYKMCVYIYIYLCLYSYNQPGFLTTNEVPHVSFKRWISAATVGRTRIARLTFVYFEDPIF